MNPVCFIYFFMDVYFFDDWQPVPVAFGTYYQLEGGGIIPAAGLTVAGFVFFLGVCIR